jgi:hypothetical protein
VDRLLDRVERGKCAALWSAALEEAAARLASAERTCASNASAAGDAAASAVGGASGHAPELAGAARAVRLLARMVAFHRYVRHDLL